jgi:GT2 family glycosyltransferase
LCAIRRSAYLEAGGLPDAFFFAHEEIDLSWRLIDRAANRCGVSRTI